MTRRSIALVLLGAALAHSAPQRIISTAPSITELLFAIGAGSRVVGVTTYCRHPAAALKIAKIGDYIHPNTEVVLGLKPDLIVSEASPLHRDVFATLGLPVLHVKFETIEDIYASARTLGKALGLSTGAEQLVHKIEADLAAVQAKVKARPVVPLFFLVGRTPGSLEGMIAVGSAPYLNQVMKIAGGTNIFADSTMRYFHVSGEQVLARNPPVIFDMGDMADTSAVSETQRKSVEQLWRGKLGNLSAVRNQRLYVVSSDVFAVPGPRVAECAREFAQRLHPEAFR